MLGDVVGCCDGCDIVMVGRVGRWEGGMWWGVAMGMIL
jgi:hypothetical protein